MAADKIVQCLLYFTPLNVADTDMDRSKWSPRQIKSGFNDPRNPYRAGDVKTHPEFFKYDENGEMMMTRWAASREVCKLSF